MTIRERIAELESEVIYLRSMVNRETDTEIKRLAHELMTHLLNRIAELQRKEQHGHSR